MIYAYTPKLTGAKKKHYPDYGGKKLHTGREKQKIVFPEKILGREKIYKAIGNDK